MNEMIYTLPFIGAFLGWITNYLAVKMLFFPREKKKVLFLEIQGVFPKRQKVVAEKIGKLVADQLFSIHDIKESIKHPDNISNISAKIQMSLHEYLEHKLPIRYPFMSLFVGDKTKVRIKEEFKTELESMAPDVMDQYISHMENDLDIEEIIREKVSNLSPQKLEQLIMNVMKKEFKFIELTGAVIGFLIGIIQLGLMMI